jgi:hypothetical protein
MIENSNIQTHLIVLGNGNRISFDSSKQRKEKLRELFEEYIVSGNPLTFGRFIQWLEKSNSSIRPNGDEFDRVGSSNINELIGADTTVLDGELQIQRYCEGIS